MAQRPLRLCHKCGNIHREHTCARCAKSERRVYDARPERKESKTFYATRAWRAFREVILAERPLCQRCETLKQPLRPAQHVHHIKPRREYPELTYEPSNMRALCHACHSAIELAIRNGREYVL